MRPFSPEWHDIPAGQLTMAGRLRVRVVPGAVGSDVVFIHGLGASLRYWGRAYDALAPAHRLIFVDLLGFGGSAKPPGPYDCVQHVAALEESLALLRVRATAVVGHSAGALVGIHYASGHPTMRVLAFGAPLFRSETSARRHLRALGPLARLMADGSPLAERLCAFMCEHRELARHLAPLLAPRLPAAVAADGVDHVWDSYKGTFDLIAHQADTTQLLQSLGTQPTLVHGGNDRVSSLHDLKRMVGGTPGVRLIELPRGDHHLPLRDPGRCAALIQEGLAIT